MVRKERSSTLDATNSCLARCHRLPGSETRESALADATVEPTAPRSAARPTSAADQVPPHPATMTPRQRARRVRLIEAALALLEEDDYERVQVKDVADRAGVSLGTLYNYFSSKERLFAEVLVRWADSLPTNVRSRPLEQARPVDRLMEVVHRALRAFERRPQMARLVNVIMMSADPLAADHLARMNRATTDAYMQALSTMDPVRARRTVDVVNAVFGVAVREWSQGRITIAEVHERLDSAIGLLLERQ
jgi:TetR/AcrR family transcriptional regulator, cholesterol catabolism regulator